MSIVRRSHAFLAAAVLVACGSVDDRPECSGDAQCAAGTYCATGSGVCWPDAVAPTVSGVTVTCAGGAAPPCPRDGSLRITATAQDDVGVSAVTATIGLDDTRPVALTCSGTSCAGTVALASYPFGVFEGTTGVRVTVRDRAGNEVTSPEQASPNITRLRWVYEAGVPVSIPAVTSAGTVLIGRSAGTEQLTAIRPDGTKAWALTVGGTAFTTAAPAVGTQAIWVGSEDGRLYAVALDGSRVLNGTGCPSGAAIRGGVAVAVSGAVERGYATTTASPGKAVAAPLGAEIECVPSSPIEPSSLSPVVEAGGEIFTASASAAGNVRRFTFTTAFEPRWSSQLPVPASSAIALGSDSAVWSAGGGTLSRTPGTGGESVGVRTLSAAISDGPLITAGGDLLVGDIEGNLRLLSFDGTDRWASPAVLGGAVVSGMVLTGAPEVFLVPTRAGTLHAVRADGIIAWSTTLTSSGELRSGTIASTSGVANSTAYFPSSHGRLFAVIVDGRLDAAAPWPKIFHDPRNTNNAGTVLP
jgi:hypothetical protein